MPNLDPKESAQFVVPFGSSDANGTEDLPIAVELIGGKRRILVDTVSTQVGVPNLPYQDYVTEQGWMFACLAEDVNLQSKTEYNNLLIVDNPIGSGKTIKIWDWNFNVVSITSVRFEMSLGATFTPGSGILVPPVNQLAGSLITSIANIRSSPVSLSIGGLFKEVAQSKGQPSLHMPTDFTTHIPPGQSLLVRGLPDANNSLVAVSLKWGEV